MSLKYVIVSVSFVQRSNCELDSSQCLHDLNNFNGLMEICAGLSLSVVSRLKVRCVAFGLFDGLTLSNIIR
jgi:hypothetical protein